MKTIDDIRDVAIRAVDNLVKQGIIPNCTDTDDDTEFTVQDTIFAEILRERALELYSIRRMFSSNDDRIIEEAIDVGILETDEILDDFKEYMKNNSKYAYTVDFDEHYENGLTHLQNSQKFEMWLEQDEDDYSSLLYGVGNDQ